MSKSEISDNPIVSTGVDEEKSEISDKGKESNSREGKIGRNIGANKKSNRKRSHISPDFIQKPLMKKNR